MQKHVQLLYFSKEHSTYADFECLDSVVQQQYVAHNLCVLPVSLQFRRPDIVGSASRQAEARAHHAPTRVCNESTHSREENMISEASTRSQEPHCGTDRELEDRDISALSVYTQL